MKLTMIVLAMLTSGLAFADPPATPTTAATPSQPPAAPPAKPATPPADEGFVARQLRLQGYKLSMVRGEEMYCRRESPLGSRLESVMHCVTVADAELMAKEGRETTERLQRTMPGCLNPAMGGCGK